MTKQLSIENLLEPISPDTPCGSDLSFSTEFDAIAEARRADDRSLDQGEWVAAIKDADWPGVITRCTSLLQSQSKDLRIAMWLTEALGKTEGLAGLAQGCELLGGMMNQYWENLHPRADDDDQELRIGNLAWLVQRIAQLLRETPLTNAPQQRYSLADHEAALALQAKLERDPDLIDELGDDALTPARFSAAQKATPAAFYRALLGDLERFENAWRALTQAIDARLGIDGPSFGPVNDVLEKVAVLLRRLAREAGVIQDTATDAPAPLVEHETAIVRPSRKTGIQSRAQALELLQQVAHYFRETEPHSPVAYLAATAVKWGEMPLHVWLRSVMKDGVELSHLEELLGLAPTPTTPPDAEPG